MRNDKSGNHQIVVSPMQLGAGLPMGSYNDGSSYGYYGVGSGGHSEKPLKEYAVILMRYWWLITLCAILGFGVGVVRNKRAPKVYASSSTIVVGTYVPAIEGQMSELFRRESETDEYFNSLLPLLSSYALATNVLKDNPEILEHFQKSNSNVTPQVQIDSENNNIPIKILDSYLKSITYEQTRNSRIVTVKAKAGNPEVVAKIANAHAEGFILMVREQRLQAASVNVEFLKGKAKDAEAKIKEISDKIRDLSIKTGINFTLKENETIERTQITRSLADSLAIARLKKAQEESIFKELSNGASSSRLTVLDPDPNIQQRLFEISQTQNEYNAIKKINARAPYLKYLEDKINLAKGTVKQFVDRQTREQEIKYKASLNQEKLLAKEFDKLKQNESENAKQMMEYRILEKELEAAKEINEIVAKRLEEAIVNAENGQKNVQLVDRALVPDSPTGLNTIATLVSGILLGIMLGVSLAFLLDFKDNSIKSVGDLKRTVDMPILGVIPNFSDDLKKATSFSKVQSPEWQESVKKETSSFSVSSLKKDLTDSKPKTNEKKKDLEELTIIETNAEDLRNTVFNAPKDESTRLFKDDSFTENLENLDRKQNWEGSSHGIVLLNSPLSRESEAFRSIRASIQCCGVTEIPHKIMVTSGQKGDGKSTVAVNLATSFAQASAKTLLIDADLRIPSVHKFFGLDRNTPGLVNFLSGEIDYTSAIIETPIPTLHVLVAGHHTRTPGELLSSRQMVELIELLSVEYDQIIIDTPPVCYVADALLLSKLVDAVALVVRGNKTPRPVAEFAFSRLKQVHAPLLGTVLNGISKISAFREPEYYYIEDQYAEKE